MSIFIYKPKYVIFLELSHNSIIGYIIKILKKINFTGSSTNSNIKFNNSIDPNHILVNSMHLSKFLTLFNNDLALDIKNTEFFSKIFTKENKKK